MIPVAIESLDALPLIAILRGLTPDEAVEVGEAIVAAGFTCLEVPLNSPQPLESIRRLRAALDGRALVGAGTVLTPEAARQVAEAGGQLVISPNTNAEVIRQTKALGLLSLPGFFTPSEAFVALQAEPSLFTRWIAVSPSLWWSTPSPDIATPAVLVCCGEAETARDMRDRIAAWAAAKPDGAIFKQAPAADHGAAPFALIPDILRHASGAEA